ncbi:MAG: SGNH/GDSL hydrolase family protein [Phycisphaerales bacterium]|nr:SGNH/GDSL hydrolase family protein [Phycisphaerales bacterium]
MSKMFNLIGTSALCLPALAATAADVENGRLTLDHGDVITIVGNTHAERMIHHPWFEVMLHGGHPEHELVVRNLGWSGDEVALQPRPLNFGTMEDQIRRTGADVIVGCFGMNESFGGHEGIHEFRTDLGQWVDQHMAMEIDGKRPVVVLVSPVAHEDLGDPLPDGRDRTHVLARYRDVMREEAISRGALFVDLVRPSRRAMASEDFDLTINGIHCNDAGYRLCAAEMIAQLGLPAGRSTIRPLSEDPLPRAIRARNELFFQRWRPVNTEYVYGRRHRPYGNQNFPGEMQDLDRMVQEGDAAIHSIVKSQAVQR